MDFWLRTLAPMMGEVVAQVDAIGDSIVWRLAPLDQDIVAWASSQVEMILARGFVKRFYFGITSRVAWRWTDASAGHRSKGWQQMMLLAVSGDSGVIVQSEIDLIARYRRHDRNGRFINAGGHMLCTNRNPGGEGGMANGLAPFVLYLVVAWNPRGGRGGHPVRFV